MSGPQCTCRCVCGQDRAAGCNDLCVRCWREWARASEKHQPEADRSYMATYGITNVWTAWIANQGASEMLALPIGRWHQREGWRSCPDVFCRKPMARRPGGWRCYRHAEPVVIAERMELERAPDVDVLAEAQR